MEILGYMFLGAVISWALFFIVLLLSGKDEKIKDIKPTWEDWYYRQR